MDRATGAIRWEKKLTAPLMGSPAAVDGVLIQGAATGCSTPTTYGAR